MKKCIISITINCFQACNKESICETYPCNKNTLTVKNFNNIEYRLGVWVNTAYIHERPNVKDTILFEDDSTWSYWSIDPSDKKTSGFYHKRYEIHQPFATGNTGSIKNFANFLNQSTTDYRTYDWYYDTAKSFVYLDFRRDFRSLSEPVIYYRFIKIQ